MSGITQNPLLLTFELLEDIMMMSISEREAVIEHAGVARIGPLVEYSYNDIDNAQRNLSNDAESPAVKAFLHARSLSGLTEATLETSLSARATEFYRPP